MIYIEVCVCINHSNKAIFRAYSCKLDSWPMDCMSARAKKQERGRAHDKLTLFKDNSCFPFKPDSPSDRFWQGKKRSTTCTYNELNRRLYSYWLFNMEHSSRAS